MNGEILPINTQTEKTLEEECYQVRKKNWIFALLSSLALIGLVFTDKFLIFETIFGRKIFFLIIFGLILFIIFHFGGSIRVSTKTNKILYLMFAMNIMFLVLPIYQLSPIEGLIGSLKFLLKSGILFFIILLLVGNEKFSFEKFVSSYINLAVFTCISSLIYYIFHILMKINLPIFNIHFNSIGGTEKSYFIFSFSNFENRIQYFFTEPSKYALFLLPAFFLSIHERNKNYWTENWKVFVVTLTIILTGSFAVWLGIFLGILFLIFSRFKWVGFLFSIFLVLIIIIFCWKISKYLSIENNVQNLPSGIRSFLWKKTSTESRSMEWRHALVFLKKYPHGYGFYSSPEAPPSIKNLTIMPIEDLARGGWWYLCFRVFCYFVLILFAFKGLFYFSWRNLNSVFPLIFVSLLFSIIFYGPFEQRIILVFLALWISSNKSILMGKISKKNYI